MLIFKKEGLTEKAEATSNSVMAAASTKKMDNTRLYSEDHSSTIKLEANCKKDGRTCSNIVALASGTVAVVVVAISNKCYNTQQQCPGQQYPW